MATPTSLLRLQIMPTSEEDWGPKTEANLNRLEEVVASAVSISTTGGTTTLTSSDYIADQSRRAAIVVSGTLVSNATIQIPTPTSVKSYFVVNATTGDHSVTLRNGASGSTLALAQGHAATILLIATGTALHLLSSPISIDADRRLTVQSPGFYAADVMARWQVDSRVLPLKSIAEQTPPISPTLDDAYYVPDSATGAWSGQDGKIARYDGSSWQFAALPPAGMLAYVEDEGKVYVTHSGALNDFVGAGGIADGGVTAPKLATNSVVTAKIADGNVTEAKIGTGAVALAKFKSDVYASEGEVKTQTNTTKIVTPDKIKHGAFPAGTKLLFQQTAAPTGWTKDTTHNNKALRVVSGTAGSGGTVSFTSAFASQAVSGTVGSTTLTENQIPAHRHFIVANISISTGGAPPVISDTNQTGRQTAGGDAASYSMLGTTTDATVGRSSSVGGGQSHTHTFAGSPIDLAVQYVDVIVCVKDSP